MARNRNDIIIIGRAGFFSPSLQREFGNGPIALRRKEHRKWGWWCSATSRSAARFASEVEARAWVYRTFKSPADHTNLSTMDRRLLTR
jgi:hypothetical protein